MRWRRGDLLSTISQNMLLFMLLTIGLIETGDGARRIVQRRKDVTPGLLLPAPTPESLQAIAQAMGAAGFETITEGKALVKRLIPANTQPDLDVVEHQGVIGKAGVDFPVLPNIPNTGFNCKNVPTGYYADLETDCQVFHICDTSRKISFLCPNGTIFSQSHLICDWWFKVDCASAPALYESSVEYYSNEQKKSQKISHSLTRNSDLQHIGGDINDRAESRRSSVNVPSTTERLLRHRQKLHSEIPLTTTKATARSYQALFDINPTQRAQTTTAFEKRRKNLVQLISNNFNHPTSRTTLPTYEASTQKTTVPVDYNSLKEMQVAAETASFANNQNRQFLHQYNSKNFRPYPVYTPNLPVQSPKSKGGLTTLYDIQAKPVSQYVEEASTKRHTLVPYTKSYANLITEKREPYTRPGVSLLRDFLDREKNRTVYSTTEKMMNEGTARSDKINVGKKVTIETKENFESATKIPLTTKNDQVTEIDSSEIINIYSTPNPSADTTPDSTYQERRERLLKTLNYEPFLSSEATTTSSYTEKYYGDQPNRPGLVVPPSLTPQTLHSLAIYYATALDNLSTTSAPEENYSTTQAIDEYEPLDENLPGLFSPQTINKYSNLFNEGNTNAELLEDIKLDPNGTYNEIVEDLSLQMSQTPLATSPQIRELAQVFTHALSAYLQDPVKFRKVLSDIRPTHPSFSEMLITTEAPFNTEPTTTVNEDDHEILGFSDDHKGIIDNSFRAGKALNIASDYTVVDEPSTTTKPITITQSSTTYAPTTPRNPFRCCGRISASYTTAPTPIFLTETPFSYSNTPTVNLNTATTESEISSSTDSYASLIYGRLQNNTSNAIYGDKAVTSTDARLVEDYSEATNLPTAWGVDLSTAIPIITNSHQMFESKRIRPTTYVPETTPNYFTDTDSIELDNEEELQRAHSQSFVAPQSNTIRQGKQLKLHEKITVRKPSEDLEAPTQTVSETTTPQITTLPSTTFRDQNDVSTTVSPSLNNIFTSPDSDKPLNEFQWSTPLGHWQSTIIDPITLNDGLSPTGPEQGISEVAQQTNSWALNTGTLPPTDFISTKEPAISSTLKVEFATPKTEHKERSGKQLKEPTSTEPVQDITTIETVVEKAKEIMEGMNATTTQKLMNVMKKTKSSTVKRLILLLVQTCDEDHNKTAEASKKALLDALMAVSQKDMQEIVEEAITENPTTVADIKTTEVTRRNDRLSLEGRRGKSLNVDAKAINSLSNPSTSETPKTEEIELTTPTTPTTPSYIKTTLTSRRGGRKFYAKTSDQIRTTTVGEPVAEARVAAQAEPKLNSDTRALELLKSLYTIAARWG